jgi:hypothetical protein
VNRVLLPSQIIIECFSGLLTTVALNQHLGRSLASTLVKNDMAWYFSILEGDLEGSRLLVTWVVGEVAIANIVGRDHDVVDAFHDPDLICAVCRPDVRKTG